MPVLIATGAGVRHRGRWTFRDLDVTVEPGELVAVVGPPGSGRTTVLLALAKRFRLTTGTVHLDGRAALGHVPEVTGPEPVFTVAEHVRERLDLLGRPARAAADVPLLGLDPSAKGWELSPYERQLLGLVLAKLEDPQLIALDGPDDGLDAAERQSLWQILRELAESGVAILVTAREITADPAITIIRLGADPTAAQDDAPAGSGNKDEAVAGSGNKDDAPAGSGIKDDAVAGGGDQGEASAGSSDQGANAPDDREQDEDELSGDEPSGVAS